MVQREYSMSVVQERTASLYRQVMQERSQRNRRSLPWVTSPGRSEESS